YRSLYLLWSAAAGNLAGAIADEGGMPSILSAGSLRKPGQKSVTLSVDIDDLSYQIVIGLVPLSDRIGDELMGYFQKDPDIKIEKVNVDYRGKQISLLARKRGYISARNMDGRPIEYPLVVAHCESVLTGLREPHLFPDLSKLRSEILSWRFYHNFRTDFHSPLRRPQVPVFTPVLSHDGGDLASALATIAAVEGAAAINEAVSDAFPDSTIGFKADDDVLALTMKMPGLNRSFSALELSDGTLQYLCLIAALLSPRPASFLALNEPETSIHPSLYEAMARLIVQAGKKSQLWVTTHSEELARYIEKAAGVKAIELEKVNGATCVVGAKLSPESEEEDYDDDDRSDSSRAG
ncbi:MAG TPA: AAA family ATPase, partial [Candidatus Obscuribacter sp.]|nr:AAA family ATPase [Candidatus Obscuribacter sp.]